MVADQFHNHCWKKSDRMGLMLLGIAHKDYAEAIHAPDIRLFVQRTNANISLYF